MNNKELLQLIIEAKNKAGKELENVKNDLKDVEKQSGRLNDALKTVGKVGLAAIATGAIAVGTALGTMAMGAVNVSLQAKNAVGDFQAQLGVTEQEAKELSETAVNIFGNNFFDSVEQASGAVTYVRQNLKGLADEELQQVVENTARLSDAFELDLASSTDAVSALMNNFGLTSEEAFDFITIGIQKGLNANGDFLDSIREYSNQFAQGNASANEFFSILKTGNANGVLGTDKIADSFKELQISIREDASTIAPYFDEIGLNVNELNQRLAEGDSIANIYNDIRGGLMNITDETRRATVTQEIFKSMGEDATQSIILGLNTAETSLEDFSGATANLDKQYSSFGDVMRGIWRTTLVQLQPVTDKLVDLGVKAIPYVEQAMVKLTPYIESFISGLIEFLPQIAIYWDEFRAKIDEFTSNPLVVEIFENLQEIAQSIITILIDHLWPILMIIGEALLPLVPIIAITFGALLLILTETYSFILNNLIPVFEVLKGVFMLVFGLIGTQLSIMIESFKFVFGALKAIVTGDMSALKKVWNDYQDNVNRILDSFGEKAKQSGKAIANGLIGYLNISIEKINEMIKGLNKVPKVDIPMIPKIPSFRSGVMNFEGGFANINEGGSSEALRMGGVTYLPTGTDVIPTARTEQMMRTENNNTDNSKKLEIGQVVINNNQDFNMFQNSLLNLL